MEPRKEKRSNENNSNVIQGKRRKGSDGFPTESTVIEASDEEDLRSTRTNVSSRARSFESPHVKHECEDKETHPHGCTHCMKLFRYWYRRLECMATIKWNAIKQEKKPGGKKYTGKNKGHQSRRHVVEEEDSSDRKRTGKNKGHLSEGHTLISRIREIYGYIIGIRGHFCHHTGPIPTRFKANDMVKDYDYFTIHDQEKFCNWSKELIEKLKHAHLTEELLKELCQPQL